MFCTKCGGEIPENASFCTKCGSPIAKPQNQYHTETISDDTVTTPKRAVIPAMGVWIGAGVIVIASLAVIIGIVGQTRTPIASFYYASENLSKDVLNIQSGSFSFDAGRKSITGDVSLDIDKESFELYCNYEGADVAVYFEDGEGAYYMSYPQYNYSTSEHLDGDTIKKIKEYFENLKTSKDSGKAEELDWEAIIKDSQLEEIIDPAGVPSSLKNLEKRVHSSKTRKELEKAMQISKDGSAYTVPLTSETICDTFEIVIGILEDECQPMFVGSTLKDFSDEYQSNIDELRNTNMNLGAFEWELDGKRFSNISMNLSNDGKSVNFDFDFDYKGNHLDSVSANIGAEGESFKLSMDDINNVKEVIPESVRNEMN